MVKSDCKHSGPQGRVRMPGAEGGKTAWGWRKSWVVALGGCLDWRADSMMSVRCSRGDAR